MFVNTGDLTLHETGSAGGTSNSIRWILLSWAGLVGLTVMSCWLGLENGSDTIWVIAALMVLAYTKVFIVGYSFMEIRTAPPVLQKVFRWWCLSACVIVIAAAVIVG